MSPWLEPLAASWALGKELGKVLLFGTDRTVQNMDGSVMFCEFALC